MSHWQNYLKRKNPHKHTISGNLKIKQRFRSPQLHNERDIVVYLPPSYAHHPEKRYPVLYMQDGQNLFDDATSFAGEWGADETMQQLSQEFALEAILVGIYNVGKSRITEYNPFQHERFGLGQGDLYLRFILETLKPEIDREFRTLPAGEHTGIVGSSMGGLISLYAFFRFPYDFGLVAAMSPSLWITGNKMAGFIEQAPYAPGKIYIDVGTEEVNTASKNGRRYAGAFITHVRGVYETLAQKGYQPNQDLMLMIDEGGTHSEASWSRRLPLALAFLLEATRSAESLFGEKSA